MMWAEPNPRAQVAECQRIVAMILDVVAGLAHQLGLHVRRRARGRAAAPAGAKSSLLGRVGPHEKGHLLAPRPPRGAGWATIHPGGAHSVDECSVGAGLARQHRLPAAFLIHKIPSIEVGGV